MSKISLSLAENIKQMRKINRISQDKLSKMAGITLHTITKIESGATRDPRVKTVKKLAGALGKSIDELLK